MANDEPGRQPFAGMCRVTCTPPNPGLGSIGQVPAHKRLVVESVSAELSTSTSGAFYIMQFNGPFTLFLTPTLVSSHAFNLNRYYATQSVRFYVEPGQSIEFQVATTGAPGEAVCYIGGYFLDV